MAKRQKKEKRSKLTEGLAECVFVDGVSELLTLGERVWIREISNMRDHCIVLRNDKPPLVGYHLNRFKIIKRDDV